MDTPLIAGVRAILAEAEADIAARRPICRSSGRCCKFEAYGHRMYVTAAEAVYFQATHVQEIATDGDRREAAAVALPQFFSQEKPEGCPYQLGGLCTAREARPLGCRVYFCDENAQGWQAEVYEKYHAMLKALHEATGLPYRYIEWREALREMRYGNEHPRGLFIPDRE